MQNRITEERFSISNLRRSFRGTRSGCSQTCPSRVRHRSSFSPPLLSLDHSSSFNRKEQDFETLDAYNDYLEMVETYSKSHLVQCRFLMKSNVIVVFNLTNKMDVEETERKIAEYKESNKDVINKNRGKLVCGNLIFSFFDVSGRLE